MNYLLAQHPTETVSNFIVGNESTRKVLLNMAGYLPCLLHGTSCYLYMEDELNWSEWSDVSLVTCCKYQVDKYKYRCELLPGVGEE